eukprot:3314998-Rhodomonas_salina.1
MAEKASAVVQKSSNFVMQVTDLDPCTVGVPPHRATDCFPCNSSSIPSGALTMLICRLVNYFGRSLRPSRLHVFADPLPRSSSLGGAPTAIYPAESNISREVCRGSWPPRHPPQRNRCSPRRKGSTCHTGIV